MLRPMNREYTIFFKNKPVDFLELNGNLGGAFRNYAFTEWQLTVFSLRFRNIPQYY